MGTQKCQVGGTKPQATANKRPTVLYAQVDCNTPLPCIFYNILISSYISAVYLNHNMHGAWCALCIATAVYAKTKIGSKIIDTN